MFLVLGEEPTFGNNESFGSPQKKFSINFNEAKTKFCESLHYNHMINTCLLMDKKSLYLKQVIKILIHQLDFV